MRLLIGFTIILFMVTFLSDAFAQFDTGTTTKTDILESNENDEIEVRTDFESSTTGAWKLPSGTEAQRPDPADSGMIRYNSEEDTFEGFVVDSWGPIAGGGGGGINYIDIESSNFENKTVGDWTVRVNSTLGPEPTPNDTGTAGPFVFLEVDTFDPWRGDASLLLNKGANSQRGYFAQVPFEIDKADLNKPLFVSFDYEASENYQAGDTLPFIWDVENNELLDLKRSGTTTKFTGRFTATDSSEYLLILHIATNNVSPYFISIDNVKVTPESVVDFSLEGGKKLIAERELSSAVTTNGTMNDLTIEGLKVGKRYKLVSAFGFVADDPSTNAGGQVNVFSGSERIFIGLDRIRLDTENVDFLRVKAAIVGEFEAQDSSLTFNAANLEGNSFISSLPEFTYVQLYEVVETKSALLSETELMNETAAVFRRGHDASSTIAEGSEDTVIWRDTGDSFDNTGGYNESTGVWTATRDGRVQFSGAVYLENGVDDMRYTVALREGSSTNVTQISYMYQGTSDQGAPFVFTAPVKKGSEYSIVLRNIAPSGSGSTLNLSATDTLSHLSISYHPDFTIYGAYSENEVSTVTDDYTIPAGAQMYTLSVDAATAEITLPTGSRIGAKRLVRKIHSTQGTIEIKASGSETITRAELLEVNLNADGDYWLLEKVSNNRWELVDGVESGENANGEYSFKADGSAEGRAGVNLAPAFVDGVFDYPNNRILGGQSAYRSISGSGSNTTDTNNKAAMAGSIILGGSTGNSWRVQRTTTATNTLGVTLLVLGRWYE